MDGLEVHHFRTRNGEWIQVASLPVGSPHGAANLDAPQYLYRYTLTWAILPQQHFVQVSIPRFYTIQSFAIDIAGPRELHISLRFTVSLTS